VTTTTAQGQKWDREVDFVAVGSGLGAVTAALAAHDAGLEVVIVEKSNKLGGVCAYSGGELFVPGNHKMAQEGAPDDLSKGKAYLDFLAGGYADEALAAKLFSHGRKAAQWLDDKAGVPWKIIKGFPDYHYPHAAGTAAHGRYLEVELFDGKSLGPWQRKTWAMSPHMPPGITHDELFAWGSLSCALTWDYSVMGARIAADQRGFGPGMMGYFLKAALVDREIEALVSTPVRELVHENGKVTGVRCETEDGSDLFIGARKGVLLAVGGYDHNPQMAKYYEGLPEWQSACQPTVEGDNLVLGGEVGACLAGVPAYNLGMFFGYKIPGEKHAGKQLWRASWEGGYPHALWVNDDGKRFCDESFYRQYLPTVHSWDGEKQRHPNFPPYLIFDSQYRAKYFFATFLPGQPIAKGMVEEAATPGELADKLGIHRGNFEATLERFNSYADTETDEDFGRGRYPWAAMMVGDRTRPNPNMGPVSEAPFYGIRLTPVGVGINAVGLRTNAFGQVMHVRGRPIEGLYACGNSAAALDTGAGYQSGLSNLRGMTWGWIAGHHAAGVDC
jgi:3-oxosteroid 1-dehydrogenase